MIYNKYLDEETNDKVSSITTNIKRIVNFKSIIFILISLALSSQNFISEFFPFSFVMLAVASVFNVPLILVLISSVVGISIGHIGSSTLFMLLGFFVIFSLITALLNIEGISKRYSVFIKFITSMAIIFVIYNFVTGTLFTTLLSTLSNLVIMAILYFTFVSGLYLLTNIGKRYVYSTEENIAMIVVVALSLTVFKSISILGFSMFNILIMILILIYGWKNGAVIGGTAGFIVGLCMTGITTVSMSFIVALAFSGFIAGILSKFGKVSVIIGFIIGNIYISYYANGFSELTVIISELLIASVSLLFMPKALEVKLDKLFNQNKTLDIPYNNILDATADVKEKIGAVSEVFENLADITIENTPEDAKETREVLKKYILDYVDNKCIGCPNKKDCIEDENLDLTIDYLSTKLEYNEDIEKRMLKFDCEHSDEIIDNIYDVYNSMKLMRIMKQKENENSQKLSKQYKEVSKILSNIAKNIKSNSMIQDKLQEKLREELKFYGFTIYEDDFKREGKNIEYIFITDILTDIDAQKKQIIQISSDILEQNMTIKLILNSSKNEKSKIKLVSIPAFDVKVGIAASTKTGENISGDSYLSMELQDLKQMTIISDGAGSGEMAAKGSSTVINMLEKLLSGGFTEEKAIEIINSVVKLKGNDDIFSTLDAIIINLKTAEAEFIKVGAAPTYILEDGKVITINKINVPIGVLKDTDYVPLCKNLKDKDIVIQISDGVVSDTMDINNNYITEYLQTLDITKSAKNIADEINKLVIRENKNHLKDDVTILVSKIDMTNRK
ncbi:MAG: SpoIIE family protein phosphatase [Clostridia bacterium]|nr:SpoIIE family protein phosphatase [Clostridia bacterium]